MEKIDIQFTNNPMISIITVVYNAVFTLEQTILSIINQTYRDIEYIIVDGGSTDGTINIIKKYEDKLAYWVSEPDKGIYDAMNKGLENVHGNFVYFLNSGDVLYKNDILDKIAIQMTDFKVVYYGNVYLSNIQKLYWGKFSAYKLAIGNICHQSIFYPQSIYKTHRYNLKYRVFADYHYNICIFIKVKFAYIDEIITKYDNQGFSITEKDEMFKKDIHFLILKNIGLLPLISRIIYWNMVSIKKIIIKIISPYLIF
jgi:glycosyltransferase involved in cell wall biosynthesis